MHLHFLMKEHGGALLETLGRLGGVVLCGAVSAAMPRHNGVAVKVIGKRCRDVFALCHDAYVRRGDTAEGVHQQGLVRATEYDGVDKGVFVKKLHDAFANKVFRSLAFRLACLHYCRP